MKLQHRPPFSSGLLALSGLVLGVIAYALIRVILHQLAGPQVTDWEAAISQRPGLVFFGVLPLPGVVLAFIAVITGLVYEQVRPAGVSLPAVNRLLLASSSVLSFLAVLLLAVSVTTPLAAVIAALVLTLSCAPYFLLANLAFYPVPRAKRLRPVKQVAEPVPALAAPVEEPAEPVVSLPDVEEAGRERPKIQVEIPEGASYAIVTVGEDATITNVVPIGTIEERAAKKAQEQAPTETVEPTPEPKLNSDEEMAERLRAARRELRSYEREHNQNS